MLITKSFIDNNWSFNKNYMFNNFVISGSIYDIDRVLDNIYSFISYHSDIVVNEDFVSEHIKKQLTNKITIELEDGTTETGIIRISDHVFDIEKWIENNEESFGISFVISEHDAIENANGEIVESGKRCIIVYEYSYNIKRNNISALNQLALQITNIKNTKHYKAGSIIYGKSPKIKKTVLEQKILKAIRKGIENLFD